MFALIMAGGSGTRLWPVSRKNQPKQLLKFINSQTLLQNTYGRLRKVFSDDKIFLATTSQYAPSIKQQLPKISAKHFSIETSTKDRGPAIGLAALLMSHYDPESCFVTSWSDHYIKNVKAYFAALKTAENFLQKNPEYFVTIGAKATYPHTGFAYIRQGKKVAADVYQVTHFKEKPDLKTAHLFIADGNYLWNTGYFACKTATLLELYEKHLPKIYQLLMKIKPFIGTSKQQTAINKYYAQMPVADIEKGLVEKLTSLAVIPAKFDWVDVGSWKIIKDTLAPMKNLTQGNVLDLNSSDSLIYNYENKLVATIGLKDAIIVNTKDALLITDKAHSEQVKQLVESLKKNKKLKKYL